MSPSRLSPLLAALLLFWFPGRVIAPPAATDAPLRMAVLDALKFWGVPGAAVVIVRDDRILYLAGHGLIEVGKPGDITPDTVFPLSSCTKAFTSALIALLAADGLLSWDDPVRDHLPWFQLGDALTSQEVRLRDLLCHRTGLAQHDPLWYHAPWGPEEAARRVRHLPLNQPFRTTLQYQSTLCATAGLAAEAAGKSTWAELLQKRILTPLGMKSAQVTTAQAEKGKNMIVGHRLRQGEPVAIAPYRFRDPDPACSLYASARDLGAWLRYQLANQQVASTHEPQVPLTVSVVQRPLFPDTTLLSYALGWVVHDHQGLRIVSHGGSIDGVRVHIALVPERNLGVAVLANLERTPMTIPLANVLIDRVLGLRPHPWHPLHKTAHERMAREARERLPARRLDTQPSRELSAYAGEYEHPAYGTVRIALRQGRLWWQWREEEIALGHYHFDTFVLPSELVGDAFVTFALNANGAVERLTLTGTPDVAFGKK